jgi:hypothetical protein
MLRRLFVRVLDEGSKHILLHSGEKAVMYPKLLSAGHGGTDRLQWLRRGADSVGCADAADFLR